MKRENEKGKKGSCIINFLNRKNLKNHIIPNDGYWTKKWGSAKNLLDISPFQVRPAITNNVFTLLGIG